MAAELVSERLKKMKLSVLKSYYISNFRNVILVSKKIDR